MAPFFADEAAAAQFSEDFQTFYAFAPFSNSHTHEHHIQKITYMGRVEKREKTTSTPERSNRLHVFCGRDEKPLK